LLPSLHVIYREKDGADPTGHNWGTKFCPVLLLGKQDHDFEGKSGKKSPLMERIGIGEINERDLCRLVDEGVAKWEDVFLG
jgi:hypothetical protein